MQSGSAYICQVAAVVDGGGAACSARVTAEVPCAFMVTPLRECSGPGDPVRHIDSSLSTRCKGCRTAGQQILARHWRRPHRGPGGDKLEDAIGDDDLLALMNAGGEPGEASERWPRRLVGGGSTGLAPSGIGGVGWNHLIRAAYGELVPPG